MMMKFLAAVRRVAADPEFQRWVVGVVADQVECQEVMAIGYVGQDRIRLVGLVGPDRLACVGVHLASDQVLVATSLADGHRPNADHASHHRGSDRRYRCRRVSESVLEAACFGARSIRFGDLRAS